MPTIYDVLIVGAGHAGAQAAISLRQRKYEGSIGLVGDEPELPYERPPLSKEYFAGEKSFERILIRPASFWQQRDITMLPRMKVVAVDAAGHTVVTAEGVTIGYNKLIWAAGGRARLIQCAGNDLAGVHTVRSRADVDRMTVELAATSRVAVIGGGYIGLEAAAVLATMGKKVIVLEALDRVLARVAGEPLSRFYEAEHRAFGVDVRLSAQVETIEGNDGRVAGVRLAGGEFIEAQMVIVGIGIIPAVDPLLEAGAEGGNGVLVDEHGRTTLTDIFAIGDCALHYNPFAGAMPIRLESVQNANDLAITVARAITGDAEPYNSVPWFWSNQYDLRLQTVGLSAAHDATVIRGEIASRSFSIVYLKEGRVIALDCVNATKDYVQGRALILSGARIRAALLSNADVPLKEMAAL